MNFKNTVLVLCSALFFHIGYAQVTDDSNVPNGINYVGFDINSMDPLPIENRGFDEIDISSNLRTKFAITELATWNGLNNLTRNNVQRTTMGLQGEEFQAWSMLHLWDNQSNGINPLSPDMQRPWMNVGTSYTANVDFMYTGLLERPDAAGIFKTDAVIAWGCQDNPSAPDNFRFLFLQPQDPQSQDPARAVQGLEMMRITPWGNVGMGNSFNNGSQPPKVLV